MKSWRHAEVAGLFRPTIPMGLEHEHRVFQRRAELGTVRKTAESVKQYHADYVFRALAAGPLLPGKQGIRRKDKHAPRA